MTTLLLDTSTQASSQRYFTWPDDEDTTPKLALHPIQTPAVQTGVSQTPLHQNRAFPFGERRYGEVRIGSVMIKLLKRYGITDEEIDQGLADYAQRTCRSAAS
ncbi:MAG: hypothetical protein R3C53_23685 [Pirellulaceae bacterium]